MHFDCDPILMGFHFKDDLTELNRAKANIDTALTYRKRHKNAISIIRHEIRDKISKALFKAISF